MYTNSQSKASSSNKKSSTAAGTVSVSLLSSLHICSLRTSHSIILIRPQNSAPQFVPLSRTWPADQASSTTTGTQVTQQGGTPLDRWENETQQQSYWTGTAEYDASYSTGGDGDVKTEAKKNDAAGQQNWSLIGDENSERF